MYKIATYFTEEQRRSVVEAFEDCKYGSYYNRVMVGTKSYCPLGLVLKDRNANVRSPVPTSYEVAQVLAGTYYGFPIWEKVRRAALRFINNFDEGKIKDLGTAFGIRR